MGGGGNSSWLNPLSIFSGGNGSNNAGAPARQQVVAESISEHVPVGHKKKRRTNTVLTTTAGDLSSTDTLKQTLGGS